jgi:hypothetical protein
MSEINVNGRSIHAPFFNKVKQGKEEQAKQISKKDGLDDVFLKIGNDTFVASGKGLDVKGIKAGDPVKVDGREGTVVSVDNKINSAKEGALAMLAPTAVSGAVGGFAGFHYAMFSEGIMIAAPISGGLAAAAFGAAVLAGTVVLGGAAYGTLRPTHPEMLHGAGNGITE